MGIVAINLLCQLLSKLVLPSKPPSIWFVEASEQQDSGCQFPAYHPRTHIHGVELLGSWLALAQFSAEFADGIEVAVYIAASVAENLAKIAVLTVGKRRRYELGQLFGFHEGQ